MKKYIGGNLSWNERQPFLNRMRKRGKLIHSETWVNQCFCGNYKVFYNYFGRIYCGDCGRKRKCLSIRE